MEALDLKKVIKELKKQIKEKEKRCEEIEALVAKQKEEDDYDKKVDLLNLDDKIDKAYEKSENARKIRLSLYAAEKFCYNLHKC